MTPEACTLALQRSNAPLRVHLPQSVELLLEHFRTADAWLEWIDRVNHAPKITRDMRRKLDKAARDPAALDQLLRVDDQTGAIIRTTLRDKPPLEEAQRRLRDPDPVIAYLPQHLQPAAETMLAFSRPRLIDQFLGTAVRKVSPLPLRASGNVDAAHQPALDLAVALSVAWGHPRTAAALAKSWQQFKRNGS